MVLVERQRLETEPQSEGSEASLPPPLPSASVCEPLPCHAAASIYDEVVCYSARYHRLGSWVVLVDPHFELPRLFVYFIFSHVIPSSLQVSV
jgi:hypothetical protein